MPLKYLTYIYQKQTWNSDAVAAQAILKFLYAQCRDDLMGLKHLCGPFD